MKFSFKASKIFVLLLPFTMVACSSNNNQQGAKYDLAKINSEMLIDEDDFNRIPAAVCGDYKDCRRASNENDAFDLYMLQENGLLLGRLRGTEGQSKIACELAQGVDDLKVSRHPSDMSYVYFRKDGDLYSLAQKRSDALSGKCPSHVLKNAKLLLKYVEKYVVNPSPHSTVVKAALSTKGEFVAWDNVYEIYKDNKVEEFQINPCHGVNGKTFNQFAVFTRDRLGRVAQVRFSNGTYVKDNISAEERKVFRSVAMFKEKEGVCDRDVGAGGGL